MPAGELGVPRLRLPTPDATAGGGTAGDTGGSAGGDTPSAASGALASGPAYDAALLAVHTEFYERRAKLFSRVVKHAVRKFPNDMNPELVKKVCMPCVERGAI